MHHSTSDMSMSMSIPRPESARYSNDSNCSSDDDASSIYMTIDNERGTEFFVVETPKAGLTKDSTQKEKQISVDPMSLQGQRQGSTTLLRHASFRLVSSPSNPQSGSRSNDPLSPHPPPKLKFVSTSLPSSTSLSLASVSKKKNLSRMQSVMDDAHLAMVEANTRKSKSLGEGRTSDHTDDFDLWLEKSSTNQNMRKGWNNRYNDNNSDNNLGGSSKPPLGPNNNAYRNSSTIRKSRKTDSDIPEDRFKCGKLCLFLPRGKGKTVRSISSTSTNSQQSCKTEPLDISRRVSMETFECGSWASPATTLPATTQENEEPESANLFFELPKELLRCSVSDMQSPVKSAFVFDDDEDKDEDTEDKATDDMDLHAFLEAQS